MRRCLIAIAIALTLFGRGAALAQIRDTSTPDGLVKSITADLLQDPAVKDQNARGIRKAVWEKFLPYLDVMRATRLTMGRAWVVASPMQRNQIFHLFAPLLMQKYATTLANAPERIDFKPVHLAHDATDTVVQSQVIGHGQQPLVVDYRLVKSPHHGWQVYDFQVAGTWLIVSYRDQFSVKTHQVGIDGLIQYLTQQNQQLDTGE